MDCDKFLIIVEKVTDEEEARTVARKLISNVGNYYKSDKEIRLTVSLGIAMYPIHGENATKLLNHTYMALEQAQKESEANI